MESADVSWALTGDTPFSGMRRHGGNAMGSRQRLLGLCLVAVSLAGCGPSAVDRAAERLEAAWSATERFDPNVAEAELRAALEISERSVAPVKDALEARIAAVRLWNDAQAALVSSDYLAAIAKFEAAAVADTYFQTRALTEAQSAERSYVSESIAKITNLLLSENVEDAFAELSTVHELFPQNTRLDAAREAVSESILPRLSEAFTIILSGDRPEDAREQLDATLAVLKSESLEAQALKARVDEAIEKAEAARALAAKEELRLKQEAAKKAADEARREREAMFAKIGCVRDDLERRGRCYDKATYSRTPSNRLYFYTVEVDGQKPVLQVRLQTRGRRWIFWEWARVYVGDQTFDIDPPWRDLVRDNGGGDTWESYARRANTQDLQMMAAIANRGEASIRFVNKDGLYREHKLTAAQVRAVQHMSAYWKEVG